MRRPHVVFPDEVPPEMLQAIHETFPGSGDKTIPLTADNWQTITDGMAAVTTTGTAAVAHLEGIDFVGKTGTAQVMSHDALSRTSKGHNTEPNAWFVGMAPRRNPDIVVAVLWEHGGWGAGSAPLAAKIIDVFVEKQRKRANNIRIATTSMPAKPEPTATNLPPAAVPSTE